jgi:diguanylate cyclase
VYFFIGERVKMRILESHQARKSRLTGPIGGNRPIRSRRHADWIGGDQSASIASAGQTILVLEPDRAARDLILAVLAAAGWQATVVADPATLLRQARAAMPEVILFDLPIAELSPMIDQIRQDPRLATVALIGLGPRMNRQERRSWLSLGLDDCLSKPLIATAVEQAIDGCLQRQSRMLAPYTQQVQRGKLVLERLAYWDEVTGLPNRRRFEQQVQQVLVDARQVQQSVAMFSLSVDQLHAITVTFGQEMGSALLQAVGQRLKQVEALAIARLGDTEFGLVFAAVWQHQQVAQMAQRLVDVVTEPYTLNGHEVRIQVSLGVASYPQHSNTGPQLLMQANTAMRWCQQHGQQQGHPQGQNGYRFYNPTMTTVEAERHLIAIDLGRAIARQELELHYQPQVDVQTGQLLGMEALVRWRHAARGMISPATFVPIAEELGLIVPIGEWVLRRACQEFMTMQQQLSHPVKLSVNLSMRQLHQGNFLETVAQILRETQMDPRQLQLELTETSLMQQVNTTIYTLQQLQQMGIGIAIDDFGTGYSSLTYLAKLPIDTLKIDHTFVSQLTLDQNAAVISNMIISMAHQLGLSIVAEGVETQGQLRFLHQLGCRSMQGYLYSPPLKAADLLRFAQTPVPAALILAPIAAAQSGTPKVAARSQTAQETA